MAKDLTELELEQLEAIQLQNELTRMELTKLRQEVESATSQKKRGAADAMKANADLAARKARCNHRTGGQGAEAILFGQGDEERPYCIGAQVFLDETIRLVCGRCGADCRNTDPDQKEWARWVGMWKHSINTQMMVIGGVKVTKAPQVIVA